ncbi:MAG TPA: hypothetical protein VKX28_08020 [Xanthobacteraceae bacterium]|nr:hypothetical protein [Xanthobacteraceae bacterium]
MSFSKLALAFIGAATIVGATAAYGVDFQLSEERHVMFMGPDGKFHEMALSDAGHKMMMEHAQALPAGAMIYRSGGKLYILRDKKMIEEIRQNGTM